MRKKMIVTLRSAVVLLMAMGIMTTFGSSAAAQDYPCVDQGGLSIFDPNKDDVLTLAELQGIADQFPDNAALQDLVDQATEEELAGIQYANCETDTTTDTTTDTATDTDTDTATDTSTDTATDTDDGSDDGDVDQLPETGQGSSSDQGSALTMLFGAMSVVMLVAAFAWRQRRLA